MKKQTSATKIHPLSRREYLSLSAAAVASLLAAPRWLAAAEDPISEVSTAKLKANPKFQATYDALAEQMRRLYGICRVKIDSRELLRPCASSHYSNKPASCSYSSMPKASPTGRRISSDRFPCRSSACAPFWKAGTCLNICKEIGQNDPLRAGCGSLLIDDC
jgi:hypothetical protein